MFVCDSAHYSCNNLTDILKDGSEFNTAGAGQRLNLAGDGKQAQVMHALEKKVFQSLADKKAGTMISGLAHSHHGWV